MCIPGVPKKILPNASSSNWQSTKGIQDRIGSESTTTAMDMHRTLSDNTNTVWGVEHWKQAIFAHFFVNKENNI